MRIPFFFRIISQWVIVISQWSAKDATDRPILPSFDMKIATIHSEFGISIEFARKGSAYLRRARVCFETICSRA